MRTVTVEISEELAQVLRMINKPIGQTVRELIVLELYRERKVSAGKSAELLGIGLLDFIQRASAAGIASFDMTDQEFAREMAEVGKMAGESRFLMRVR